MFRVKLEEGALAAAGSAADGTLASLPEELSFTTGPGSVDAFTGRIRLFRSGGAVEDASRASRTLCIVAIPSSFAPRDLMHFFGPFLNDISHARFLRPLPVTMARYMSLLSFVSQDAADKFFRGTNGRAFSTFENERCHVVYVAGVTVELREGAGAAERAVLASDPLAAALPPAAVAPTPAGGELVELPTCPVCLERLDASVSGITSTLCTHDFHSTCLAAWQSTQCPVCRHTLAPEDEAEDPVCENCGEYDGLWICLVCGHVGCSRMRGGHALAHFRSTGHGYALELSSQRVWSYCNDAYVHRLIASHDHKLVELPDPRGSGGSSSGGGSSSAAAAAASRHGSSVAACNCSACSSADSSVVKSEAIAMEFTMLLTQQLEVQRGHYESLMAQLYSLIPQGDESLRAAAEDVIFSRGRGHRFDLSSSSGSGGGGGGGMSRSGRVGNSSSGRDSTDFDDLKVAAAFAASGFEHAPFVSGAGDAGGGAGSGSSLARPLPRHPATAADTAGGGGAGSGVTVGAGTGSSSSRRHTAAPLSGRFTPLDASDDATALQLSAPDVLSESSSSRPAKTGVKASPSPARPSHPSVTDPPQQQQLAALQHRLSSMELEVSGLRGRVAASAASVEAAEARAAAAEADRRAMVRQLEAATERSSLAREELAFLRDVNDSLSDNVKALKEKSEREAAAAAAALAASKAQVADLEEQLRDVLLNMEAARRIQEAPEGIRAEIAGGSVGVTASPAAPTGGRPTARRLQQKLKARAATQAPAAAAAGASPAAAAPQSSTAEASGAVTMPNQPVAEDDDGSAAVVAAPRAKEGKHKRASKK